MLNHAIATAMVHGPAAGLQRLDGLAGDARLAKHTAAWTRCAPTCWSGRATARAPSPSTGAPLSGRRARRSGTTS